MNKSRLMTFVRILSITTLLSTLVSCSKGADTEKALQEAQVKIQQLTDEANRLKSDSEGFRLEIKDLQTQNADLETKNKQIILLKQDSETRQGELEAAQKRIAEAQVKIQQLTGEANRLMTENESFHLKIKDLQAQNTGLETENKQIVLLEQDLKTHKRELETAEKRIVQAQLKIQQLTDEIGRLLAENESLLLRIRDLQTQNVGLEKENKQISLLEQDLRTHKLKLETTEKRISELEKHFHNLNSRRVQLANELKILKEAHQNTLKDLQSQSADLETKNKQIVFLKQDNETHKRKLERAEKRATELEKHFRNLSTLRVQLANELKTLNAAHGKSLNNISELETKLVQKDEIIDHANAQLERLQARQKTEAIEYQDQVTAHVNTITALNKRIAVISKEKEAEEQNSVRLKGELQQQIDAQSQRLKEKETRIAELEQTKKDLTEQLHLAAVSLEKFKTAHADELKKSNTLENLVQEREKELKAADARVQDLEASQKKRSERLHQIESVIQALKLDKDTALSRIQELQHAVAGSGEALAQMNANLSRSKKEKEQAQNAILQLKRTYTELVKEFESEIKNQEATIRGLKEKLSITFMDDILYDLSVVSVNSKAQQALAKIGRVLRQNPDNKIVVAGHTDNMPIKMAARDRFPSNWELSAARAAAVVRHFQQKLGIDPARMEIVGHAYYKPVAGNDTPQNRSKNRRVEIFIMPLR